MDGVWRLVVRLFSRPIHNLAELIFWLFPCRFKISERLQRQHSFIVGRTGAGKSVLLHHFIRHYLTRNKKPAVVLLDPHGDLAKSVALDRTWLKSDRLVYIQFQPIGDQAINFNPFDLTKSTETYISRAQLQFAGAIERIIGEPFTPRQRTLIRSCVSLMLHRPNSTLIDLVRLLQDGQNADLLEYGREQLPNLIDRQFFTGSFSDPLYSTTKLALVSRLTDIIRDPVVRRFTCQPSSLDLGKLLDSGKVIVVQFDPSKQGRDTIRTIGQLLTAAIFSHALGRPPNRRFPIHLLADEAQYFVGSTITEILGESRKFGLYLTLATQRTEALSSDLQDAILGNVGNLWIGSSRHQTAEKLAKETGIASERLRNLPNLNFLHVVAGKEPVRHKLRYLGRRFCMSRADWRKIMTEQIKRYYPAAKTAPVKNIKPDTSQQKNTWEPEFL